MCARSPSGDALALRGGWHGTGKPEHWYSGRSISRYNWFDFQKFSGILDFQPKKSGRTHVRPELFWIFQISNRKKYGRRNFNLNFFAIFNFQPENFFGF
jgi:hypothetical protein